MFVEKDLKKYSDLHAMVMNMCAFVLSNIPCEFHDRITRKAKRHTPERVRDIADTVVDRVPVNPCKHFLATCP